jgi:CheY-like chemotaxis protein
LIGAAGEVLDDLLGYVKRRPSAWPVGSVASDARQPYLAEAIRDGLRLAAIAADIAGDGDTALELLSINTYDIAVLDRDTPGPSGDEIAKRGL